MRSFDVARERPAPRAWSGHGLDGAVRGGEFTRRTLVVAVKSDCLGCRDVREAVPEDFAGCDVLFVARTSDGEPGWAASSHEVVVSPALLDELAVRWPPFYVLIDPSSDRVVTEGVVFSLDQLRDEVAPYLV